MATLRGVPREDEGIALAIVAMGRARHEGILGRVNERNERADAILAILARDIAKKDCQCNYCTAHTYLCRINYLASPSNKFGYIGNVDGANGGTQEQIGGKAIEIEEKEDNYSNKKAEDCFEGKGAKVWKKIGQASPQQTIPPLTHVVLPTN